jgi:transposase
MGAYSIDLRERVLADYDSGMGNDAVARKYRVSSRWVYKLRRQRSETGDIAPRRGKTGPKPKLAQHTEHLLQLVEEQSDATLGELRQQLGVPVSLTTLWKTLKALGVTLKKSPAGGRTRPARRGSAPHRLAILASSSAPAPTGFPG